MVQFLLALIFLPWQTSTLPSPHSTYESEDSVRYYDAMSFDVIGKYHDEKNWGRFPERYEKTLREPVWKLSRNSAGISVRFASNASTIIVRWEVLNGTDLKHMPATGVRGVDLYAFTNGDWQFVRTGFPGGKTTEYTLLSNGDGSWREYLLNLPLYDGVVSLEIGVNESAVITKAKVKHLLQKKAVVYYGTSIAQGACASRPGLAFTNILSRKLDRPFINFGFSGNGTIEISVAEGMAEIDAALYVVDCNANTQPDLVYDRAIALVKFLNQRRPEVPVLLVEGFMNESFHLTPASGVNEKVAEKNEHLRRAYIFLRENGLKNISYKTADGLIGDDHEGTVDGIHPNDIGMMRIADALFPVVDKIL